MTSLCPLRVSARRFPHHPAIVRDVQNPWTFARWDAIAEGLRPLARGDGLLAIAAPDTPLGAALLIAAWREGRPALLLSHRLSPTQRAATCERLGVTACLDASALALPGDDLLTPDPTPTAPAGPAVVLLTSGSSGQPKAVVHSVAGLMANAAGSHANIPFGPGDVWLRSLSLHHVGGLAMLLRALYGGGAVAFPAPREPLGAACRRLGASHLSVVSAQLRWLLDAAEGPPPGLRALLVGGGPIPEELVDAALARGLPIHTTYGMTEMGSQVSTTPPGATRARLRTAGRPLPGREVRIAADGEILVRGSPLFLGYLPGAGAPLDPGVDGAGWYHTGDVGALTEGGWLQVRGRKDQMFISGGENIHPEEIERALMGLDAVAAAAVVAAPHPTWGARPVAFVRAMPFDEEGIRAALAERLERFKVPERVLPWPAEAPGWEGKPPRAWLAAYARKMG